MPKTNYIQKSKRELKKIKRKLNAITKFVKTEIMYNFKIIQACYPDFFYNFGVDIEKVRVNRMMYKIDQNLFVRMSLCDFYRYLIQLSNKIKAIIDKYSVEVRDIENSLNKHKNKKINMIK